MSSDSNGHTRSPYAGIYDPIAANQLRQAVVNATTTLSRLNRGGLSPDVRRDIDDECGFPKTITVQQYRDLYDRLGVAQRVVQLMPYECWQVTPEIYEEEDPETATPFEQAWDDLCLTLRGRSWFKGDEGNPVWEALRLVDELSGIGSFGLLLLGLDDGRELSLAVEGIEEQGTVPVEAVGPGGGRLKPGEQGQFFASETPVVQQYALNAAKTLAARKLLYLRAFDESLITVASYEVNRASPRYGQPVTYSITFDNRNQSIHCGSVPMASSALVHWTRVIHVASDAGNELFGVPRLRSVFNNLMSLRKLADGGPEAYWKGCLGTLSFETHPQLGADVDVDVEDLRDMVEDLQNGLQRFLVTTGMSARNVAPSVTDPRSQIDAQLELICIQQGVPKRIFIGSERGQLASSQDDSAWNERKQAYQNVRITPHIIIPFVDRLILVGVLPEPAESWKVVWPDLGAMSEEEKATVAGKRTDALAKYVTGGVDSLIEPMSYLTLIHQMPDEDAQTILEKTAEHQANQPLVPQPTTIPPPKPKQSLTTHQKEPTAENRYYHRDSRGRFDGGGGGSKAGELRSARAKATHKPATVEKQHRGVAEQQRLAKLVGGTNLGDNEAFDVMVGRHALEVKTLIDNRNSKITMHPDSLRRKVAQAQAEGLKLHTVVIDVSGPKRRYYHRAAVGSFRVSAMNLVTVSQLRGQLR